MLSSTGSGTMMQFGYTTFIKPMSVSLKWSRAIISLGMSFRIIVGGLLSVLIGPIIDRYGIGRIMFFSGLTASLCTYLITKVYSPWQFLVLFGIAGGFASAGAGEFAIGSVIPKWFIKKRGKALAFGTMGGVLVGVFITPIMAILMDNYGWKYGWFFISGFTLITIIPASFFMKRRPEDIGLLPDGIPMDNNYQKVHVSNNEISEGYSAMKTIVFWQLIIAFNLNGLAITGIVVHELSYLLDNNFSAYTAALIVSIHALSGIGGRFVWGYFVDRIAVKYCLAISSFGAALATVILLQATSIPVALLFAIIYGLNIGGEQLLNAVAWSEYFDRNILATIRGFSLPFQLLSRAAGPFIAGILFSINGSYLIPFSLFIITLTCSSLMFLSINKPNLDHSLRT